MSCDDWRPPDTPDIARDEQGRETVRAVAGITQETLDRARQAGIAGLDNARAPADLTPDHAAAIYGTPSLNGRNRRGNASFILA